jgi:anaerobic ribonucleoside-triphosphate reductase activating protein
MLIHAILPVSQVNGPCRRAVVFVQGCRLACDGCWNIRTHPFVGAEIPVTNVLDRVLQYVSEQRLDGVTLSGGEPMHQALDVGRLLKGLRASIPAISIGMFTGYSRCELDQGKFWTRQQSDADNRIGLWQSIRKQLDFAVMGRYNRLQPSADPLCSSKNQTLYMFTARHCLDEFAEQSVEIAISAGGLTTITGFPTLGIPA